VFSTLSSKPSSNNNNCKPTRLHLVRVYFLAVLKTVPVYRSMIQNLLLTLRVRALLMLASFYL
jgi:hypothetical protein